MGPRLIGVLGTPCFNPMSIFCGVILYLILRLVLFCRNVFCNSRQDSRLLASAVPRMSFATNSTLSLLPAVGGGRVHRNCHSVWVPNISGLMSKALVMMGCLTQTNACSMVDYVQVRDSINCDANFSLFLLLLAATLIVLCIAETMGHCFLD